MLPQYYKQGIFHISWIQPNNMNKKILVTIIALLMSTPLSADAATKPVVEPIVDKVLSMIPEGTILDSLIPSRKNCNYVDKKLYEPFSDIDSSFPGVGNFMENGSKGRPCVKITGGTEKLIVILFTTAITIIIVMTVINIAVAGIQYMTEQAAGQVAGKGKKRLMDSLVALALGLLSYTILYTVNKQLVNFTFNPVSIDATGAIDRGIKDANNNTGTFSSGLGGIESVGGPTFAQSPTGYINKVSGTPCQAPSPSFIGPPDPNCVQQSTLSGGGGGVSNSTAAKSLNDAALQMLGQTTCKVDFTNGGTLACAYVVNSIINNALGKPLTGQTNQTDTFGRSTSEMKGSLDSSSGFFLVGTSIGAIQAGDIIISPTVGSNVGHVGIYTSTGKIISNSSSQTKVDDHFTPISWANYYTNSKHLETYIYRAGSQ